MLMRLFFCTVHPDVSILFYSVGFLVHYTFIYGKIHYTLYIEHYTLYRDVTGNKLTEPPHCAPSLLLLYISENNIESLKSVHFKSAQRLKDL